jgi:DNA-binding transcriptional MerR regulator
MGNLLSYIPAKRYFTIGEVAELCGVKPHVLRYWEQEFNQLRPMKRRGNRRYYQHHEVHMVRRIRELLYDQGFTIIGARTKLQEVVQADRDKRSYAQGEGEHLVTLDDDACFARLDEVIARGADDAASQHLVSVRQELFEIRDLLAEVL